MGLVSGSVGGAVRSRRCWGRSRAGVPQVRAGSIPAADPPAAASAPCIKGRGLKILSGEIPLDHPFKNQSPGWFYHYLKIRCTYMLENRKWLCFRSMYLLYTGITMIRKVLHVFVLLYTVNRRTFTVLLPLRVAT